VTKQTMEAESQQQREKLAEVLDFWTNFDLDGRRQKMDNQCLELKEGKEAAQRSRKMLAESTKEFKKMGDSEKILTAKDLIKSYQVEIDTLTKRARASDGAFFALYKDLYEAPDPAHVLRIASSARPRAAATELEMLKLRGEIEAYEAEFKVLKNQDISIRTLEEQVEDLEESMERKVAEQLEVVKSELEVETARKVEEVLEREAILEQRLLQAQQCIIDSERACDRLQSKVFEITKVGEERAAASSAELQILAESNEKHQAAVGILERENEVLRGRFETSASQSASLPSRTENDPMLLAAKLKRVEGEVSELRNDNGRLHKEVLSRDRCLEAATKAHEENQRKVESHLKSATLEVEALRSDLAQRSSVQEVDELRKQLRQLQKLEFNAYGGEEEEDGSSGAPTDVESASSTMERMLLVRLRRVENSEMQYRRKADEVEVEASKLSTELSSAREVVDGLKKLVEKLESDLARKNNENEPPLATLLNSDSDHSTSAPPEDMLSIVQAQRDRFMARITELEKEKAALARQIATLKSTSQQLQRDNKKLYEKFRSVNKGVVSVEDGLMGETELRYRNMYDQTSPFASFGEKRKANEMSMADKITLSTTRMFLASKQARNIAFFYVLFLHLLVFVTTFHWSHSAQCPALPPPREHLSHMVGAPQSITMPPETG